jgi:alkaline phosphatase
MSKMPVIGMQTTYDSFALMTDSASAGTAFACGLKTESAVIGMDSTKTKSYKSVAQLAQEQGKRVGIVTSVSLDHATPASYYASVPNRGLHEQHRHPARGVRLRFLRGGRFRIPPQGRTAQATPITAFRTS